MPRKRFSPEQIIAHLREAEVLLAKGQTAGEVCRHLGVSEQTYYRRRKEYGGLEVDQAKRLKALERENARLKKVVADQALDLAILKEVNRGNFWARHGDAGRSPTRAPSWRSPRAEPAGCWSSRGRRSGTGRGWRTTRRR